LQTQSKHFLKAENAGLLKIIDYKGPLRFDSKNIESELEDAKSPKIEDSKPFNRGESKGFKHEDVKDVKPTNLSRKEEDPDEKMTILGSRVIVAATYSVFILLELTLSHFRQHRRQCPHSARFKQSPETRRIFTKPYPKNLM
jgi:hypothetical protein